MSDHSAVKNEATKCVQLLMEALRQYPDAVSRFVV